MRRHLVLTILGMAGWMPGTGVAAEVARLDAWQPLAAGVTSLDACAISPEQRFVAFGRGNRLLVYDRATGEIEAELVDPEVGGTSAAHVDLVQSLDFNRNGLLASGGFRVVKFWERAAIRREADLEPPAAAIASLGEAADGSLLAAGGIDGEVVVWASAEREKSALRWRDHGSVAVVATGRCWSGPRRPVACWRKFPPGREPRR